ncbi:trypsin-1-like protein, partial [Leptotrombidium deliense]
MNALLYFFASIILTIYANNSNSTEYDKCGIANKEKITPRIFGGAVVSNNKYPWMAAVVRKSNNVDWRCGGSLISSNAIITAAHCVHGVKEDRLQVILGTNDIKSNDMH